MSKKAVRLFILHILAFLLIAVFVFKFSEEIADLKLTIYSKLSGETLSSEVQQETKDAAEWETAPTEATLSFQEQVASYVNYPKITHSENAWYQSNQLVYHAAGGIDGLSYTNSQEAMEQCIQSGNSVIEIDFHFTSDNQLVCVHEWTELLGTEEPCTLEDYLSLRIYGKYTPMTAENVIQYMKQNPELYIVIDTKANEIEVIRHLIGLCQEDSSLIDRFIIQLYSNGEKEVIQEIYPFQDQNFLFTLYRFGQHRYEDILRTLYEENIPVITVGYTVWNPEVKAFFQEKGFRIFEHTINRPDWAKDAIDHGAYGIYTDFLTQNDIPPILEQTNN